MEKKTEDFHFNGIKPGTPIYLEQLITAYPHQVISLQMIDRDEESVQVFFFDQEEGISTDIQDQDILYVVTNGNALFTVDHKEFELKAGECMLVPSGCPHSIHAITALRLLQISVGVITAGHGKRGGFNMSGKDYIKNVDKACVHTLSELIGYQDNKVASITLVQRDLFTTTIMAMDKGTGVGPHACEGDAMVIALEGEGDVMIGEELHLLKQGECIVMPVDIPHRVRGERDRFKMMLIVSKPELPNQEK